MNLLSGWPALHPWVQSISNVRWNDNPSAGVWFYILTLSLFWYVFPDFARYSVWYDAPHYYQELDRLLNEVGRWLNWLTFPMIGRLPPTLAGILDQLAMVMLITVIFRSWLSQSTALVWALCVSFYLTLPSHLFMLSWPGSILVSALVTSVLIWRLQSTRKGWKRLTFYAIGGLLLLGSYQAFYFLLFLNNLYRLDSINAHHSRISWGLLQDFIRWISGFLAGLPFYIFIRSLDGQLIDDTAPYLNLINPETCTGLTCFYKRTFVLGQQFGLEILMWILAGGGLLIISAVFLVRDRLSTNSLCCRQLGLAATIMATCVTGFLAMLWVANVNLIARAFIPFFILAPAILILASGTRPFRFNWWGAMIFLTMAVSLSAWRGSQFVQNINQIQLQSQEWLSAQISAQEGPVRHVVSVGSPSDDAPEWSREFAIRRFDEFTRRRLEIETLIHCPNSNSARCENFVDLIRSVQIGHGTKPVVVMIEGDVMIISWAVD